MAVLPQPTRPMLVKALADLAPDSLITGTARAMGLTAGASMLKAIGNPVKGFQWHLTTSPAVSQHPWDVAHAFSRAAAAGGQPRPYVEPDLLQDSSLASAAVSSAAMQSAQLPGPTPPTDLNQDWPPKSAVNAPLTWHLEDAYSGLKAARNAVGDSSSPRRVRIAHLDTGYSEQHETCPLHLRRDMAWNFVENTASAVDPGDYHGVLQNPGHGTATIGLLAGNRCSLTADFLGGAPFAEVVPVRIADSVVHFLTSAIADGINHVLQYGCDVISLSMGGVPAQSWADAVNAAYEAGCAIYAASGDSYGGLPTRFTVYPARFRRVVSVCGVTYDGMPYFDPKYDLQSVLEGNFGPDAAMATAISSYSPNILKALIATVQGYSRAFEGTSASTPQAAAAAALYIQAHMSDLAGLQGWQRVEAVRYALFNAAQAANQSNFGRGLLRAAQALAVPVNNSLPQEPPDTIDFALLKELFGWNFLSSEQQNMLEVESAQLTTSSGALQTAVGGLDQDTTGSSANQLKQAVDALAASPSASQTLKTFLNAARARM